FARGAAQNAAPDRHAHGAASRRALRAAAGVTRESCRARHRQRSHRERWRRELADSRDQGVSLQYQEEGPGMTAPALKPKAMIQDNTRCIGCRACMVACKAWNDRPADDTTFFAGEGYQNPRDLDANNY